MKFPIKIGYKLKIIRADNKIRLLNPLSWILFCGSLPDLFCDVLMKNFERRIEE